MVQALALPSILSYVDRPPPKRREVLANGDDVTDLPDRALLLRTFNEVLRGQAFNARLDERLGSMVAEQALLRKDHNDLKRVVGDVHERVLKLEHRPPAPSVHDFKEEIKEAVEDAVEKTNPNMRLQRLDSDRVKDVVKHTLTEAQLREYQQASTHWWRLSFAILAAALMVVGSLLVWALTRELPHPG